MAIYSYLQGGLGNQLFQYAIARALSAHYQVDFTLDRSWFDMPPEGVTPREFQLDLLNIQKIVVKSIPFPKKPNRLHQFLQTIFSNKPFIYYQKSAFDFNSTLLNLHNGANRDIYLSGYWQGFGYIENIHPVLQEEFDLRSDIDVHYQPFLQQIMNSESVMLHLRRGDYVHSPSAAQFHGALSLDYYQNAMQAIKAIQPDAHFFVFSDDLPWARANLPTGIPLTFIENSLSEDAAVQELQLMRNCKHHIIANSSLSWWGAWLKTNADGTVFAPNRWVNNANINLNKLLPPNWQRLPA